MAKILAKTSPSKYTIEIRAIPPVAFAVPGIRKVAQGDIITFDNKTGGPVRVSTAADEVFKGIKRLKPKLITTDGKKDFTVEKSNGTFELSIHYRYHDKTKDNRLRTGFAIGASSPKIIIVPPKQSQGSRRP